jgi:hypothetical protein
MIMSQRLHAICDGEVLRPEGAVDLEPNARYSLIVEKDDGDGQVDTHGAYPLTVIQNLAIDMGVKDLAENDDRYAHAKLEH